MDVNGEVKFLLKLKRGGGGRGVARFGVGGGMGDVNQE